MSAFCAPLIARLRNLAGDSLQISLNVADPEHIARQMEEGDFDVLIDSSRMIPPGLKSLKLQDEAFVMAQRHSHPRGTGPLDLHQYCGLNHLIVSPERASFRGYMDQHITAAGLARNIILSVPQAGMVPLILKATDLVCTLPRLLIEASGEGLDTFALPFESEVFELKLAWHPRDDSDAASQWLRTEILNI